MLAVQQYRDCENLTPIWLCLIVSVLNILCVIPEIIRYVLLSRLTSLTQYEELSETVELKFYIPSSIYQIELHFA
jgi:hypothetical protein